MTDGAASSPSLERRLGTRDAVVVGLAAMLGAGVFSAFTPAAAAAGNGLLIGLAVAAGIAYCNAVSSAQLAAQYPTSGGTYVYGRERLGEWPGFLAGWGFVIGKTASCAAMAMTFAAYAVDGPNWAQRLVALVAVVVLTSVNLRGITRTAALGRLLVTLTLLALTIVVAAIALSGDLRPARLTDDGLVGGGIAGVLEAAGLLFFAFAGYARIATLGEEVRDPVRTIPRAIPLALGIVVAIYTSIATCLLLSLGSAGIAATPTPLAAAVDVVGAAWAEPVVRVGATVAALGSLLALVAGVGRTTLAMAREGDLPRWLSSVGSRFQTPYHAELVVGGVVAALVLTADLRGVIGFSSFGVLLYYAVANLAAFTQSAEHRRWPRVVNVVGLVGCLTLVVALPLPSLLVGLLVLAIGVAGRSVVLARRRRLGS